MVKTKPVKKVALILLFAAMAVAQDTRPTVAILDFESQGISEQEVKTLTERMRSEIGATNAVRLTHDFWVIAKYLDSFHVM